MTRHARRPRFLRVARVRLRRQAVWVDRRAAALLPLIPSWGASLLLHTGLVLLLALYLYVRVGRDRGGEIQARFDPRLDDDLTTLGKAEQAGDPFTRIKTDEAPSLSLKPAEPDASPERPELPDLAKFAPDLAGPELSRTPEPPEPVKGPKALTARRRAKGSVGLGTMIAGATAEDVAAPFTGRSPEQRAKLVRREGGTVHSEKAVEDGLNWIVRHQRADGGWSLNTSGQCEAPGCPPRGAMASDTAATGLALLPLLAAGHSHTVKSRYQPAVRRGLAWLMENQQDSGDLFIGPPGMAYLYSHAIGTMALCEAYGLTHDAGLRPAAQRAVGFIVEAQSQSSGGWRYAPGQNGDTSVFGWQVFALRSARLAGLKVPLYTLKGCKTYLDQAAADPKGVTYGYLPGRPAASVMTAEALLGRQYLGWPREYPPLVKGAGMVANDLNESTERNIYYWYYATQLLHNMQNKDWERWNVRVRDGLVAMQTVSNGCDRGSWDPEYPQPDHWGRSAGRLFLTSLSVLTLEVYYRYLPLYKAGDNDPLLNDPVRAAGLKDKDAAASRDPETPAAGVKLDAGP